MSSLLGLILFFLFIACVIAAAAGITWVVVRVSPKKEAEKSSG